MLLMGHNNCTASYQDPQLAIPPQTHCGIVPGTSKEALYNYAVAFLLSLIFTLRALPICNTSDPCINLFPRLFEHGFREINSI